MEQENKQKKSYLSWDKAILSVLEEEGKSMHYRTIAERIIEHGLVKTSGATPANTVNAYLHGGKLSSKVTCVRRGEYILTDLFKQDPSLVVLPQSPGDVEDEESNVDDALITAYGRFWSRCIWEQNNKNLYGASSNTSNATGVDFTTCSGIYLLHKGYEVIYVGQATKLCDRLSSHTKDDKRNRWDNFSWFSLDEIESNENKEQKQMNKPELLDTLEALLIETLGPERNKKVGNGFEDKEFEQISELEFRRRQK